MTLPLNATAQEQLSLDEYFKGTGLEGQINAKASDFEPLNAPVPAAPGIGPAARPGSLPPLNSNGSIPGIPTASPYQQSPRFNPGQRPFVPSMPLGQNASLSANQSLGTNQPMSLSGPLSSNSLGSGRYDRSQIDPLTGLPLHMTTLGPGPSGGINSGLNAAPNMGAADFNSGLLPAGLFSSGIGQSASVPQPTRSSWNGPAPGMQPRQEWAGFPTQQQPIGQSGVVQVGHTGPILFAGNIEPLAPGEVVNAGGLPTSVPLPDQVASRDSLLPELQDFGDLTTNLLEGMKGEPYDRSMEDLCISRKGYVVLEHWGWHATALAGRRNSLGMTNVQASFTLSFPQLVDGLTVRPQFGWHQLSGPSRTDMPGQVFDVMVEGAWRQRVTDRAYIRVAGTAGLYTDFDQSGLTDGVRVSGMALGTYEVSDALQLVLGAAVINLENRRVLPIAGVVFHPDDDLRMELMFPEGRIARRIDPGRDYDRWIYVAGSFFGRTWNIARSSGVTENVTYSDWRVGLGIESHLQTRAVWYLELGASLGRELEYESHVGDYDPSTTGYLRGGIYY